MPPLTNLPDGVSFADAAAAVEIKAASQAWPSAVVGGAALGALELLLGGFAEPSDRWQGDGLLRLRFAPPEPMPAGGWLALRDPEGTMLAAAQFDAGAAAGAESPLRRLVGVELPAHYDAGDLRGTAAAIRGRLPAGNAVAAILDAPLLRGGIDFLKARAAAEGAHLLLLGCAPAAEPDDELPFVHLRCWRAALAEFPPGSATLAALPARVDDPALAAEVAARCGAGSVADLPADQGAEATPAVAAVLRDGFPPRSAQGFTVFFTGLSGSGKSTVARALLSRLREIGGRRVTLLDGDLVRRNLSSELGFSKEHRNLNILRIGYVAKEITKHGGIAICCPIAPYDGIRKQVRALIEPSGGFLLAHIATPLEVCEARDRKGLYAKARAGLIKEFTGISDPYEEPEDAEITIQTGEVTPAEAAGEVIARLRALGYLAAYR